MPTLALTPEGGDFGPADDGRDPASVPATNGTLQAGDGLAHAGDGRPLVESLDLPVLLVNRLFQPVQITTARRGFLLLYGGSALAIDEAGDLHDFQSWKRLPVRDADDGLPIVGGALRVPRVLHLRRYDRARRPTVRLTRRNLMLRDGHQCQYCLRRPSLRDLNIDHVVPRSRGGEDTWENLVTACRACNLRKGRRTPEEAAMRLVRPPSKPRWSTSAQLLLGSPHPFKEWDPFLKAG